MTDAATPTVQSLRDKGVTRVELGLTDIDGVLRGKYVSLDKFASLLGDGGGFCDCVFGWDVADQLYDNARYTGWHTGYPDAHFKLIADTQRWVPDTAHAVFRRRVRRPGRRRTSVVSAHAAALGAGAGGRAGPEGQTRLRVRVLRVRRNAAQRPRKRVPRPEAADAGQLRLFGVARVDPLGPVHRTDGLRDRARLSARSAALRDRSGRLGRRARGDRRACRVRPREPVQDVHESLLPEARPDGDVHGEVVDEVPGAERSLPLFVLGRRRCGSVLRRQGAVSDERGAAPRARRTAAVTCRSSSRWLRRPSTATRGW